jgi:hypothetical protein
MNQKNMSNPGKKLQLKEHHCIELINSPYTLADLLPGYNSIQPGRAAAFDSVILFVRSRTELAEHIPKALSMLGEQGLLWVAYPKKSSGMKSDINRDEGWGPLLDAGYGPVRQVSIDDTWSALRWRPEKDISRKRDSTFNRGSSN